MKDRSLYVAGLAWVAFIGSMCLPLSIDDRVMGYWLLLLLGLVIFGFILTGKDKAAYPREARSARRSLFVLLLCWVLFTLILPMI